MSHDVSASRQSLRGGLREASIRTGAGFSLRPPRSRRQTELQNDLASRIARLPHGIVTP